MGHKAAEILCRYCLTGDYGFDLQEVELDAV